MKSKIRTKAQTHPAETTAGGLAAAIVVILAALDVDVSETAVAAIVAGVGAIPALVTAIVNRIRGS